MDEAGRACPGCSERDRLIDELQQRVAALLQRVADLEKRLDDKERAGKRQAAPFAKGPPKTGPKQRLRLWPTGPRTASLADLRRHRRRPKPDRAQRPGQHRLFEQRSGMSYGKIADYFKEANGIDLQPSTATRIVRRAADKLQPVYQEIRESIHLAGKFPELTGNEIP